MDRFFKKQFFDTMNFWKGEFRMANKTAISIERE